MSSTEGVGHAQSSRVICGRLWSNTWAVLRLKVHLTARRSPAYCAKMEGLPRGRRWTLGDKAKWRPHVESAGGSSPLPGFEGDELPS